MESPLDTTFGASLIAFLDTSEDFHKHRKRLNRRIRRIRHDLGIITTDTKNYKTKEQQSKINVDNYDSNPEYGVLLLLTAERDYAYSRELKYLMEIGSQLGGSYRNLMVSRLKRSLHNAKKLLVVSSNEANKITRVEAFVYAAIIQGVYAINKKHWQNAVVSLADARCGVELLISQSHKKQEAEEDEDSSRFYLRELLDSIIDPSLTLAHSQLDSPATDLKSIARRFSKQTSGTLSYLQPLVELIRSIDASFVTELKDEEENAEETELINSIQWRSHEAKIYNEEVAYKIMKARSKSTVGLDATQFTDQLVSQWTSLSDLHETDNSNRDEDDHQMVQDRAILSTYLKYQELFAKIRRDLLFIGESSTTSNSLLVNKQVYWLYNSIVSTVGLIKDLPGVYNDEELYQSLNTLERYYQSLKLLKLADSFAINENYAESLKLHQYIKNDLLQSIESSSPFSVNFPYDVASNSEVTSFVQDFNKKFRQIHILTQFNNDSKTPKTSVSVIENASKYPITSNLDDIVKIQKIQPILSKPVLFDIGFNYINYDTSKSAGSPAPTSPAAVSSAAGDETKKSGFFGMFGRA